MVKSPSLTHLCLFWSWKWEYVSPYHSGTKPPLLKSQIYLAFESQRVFLQPFSFPIPTAIPWRRGRLPTPVSAWEFTGLCSPCGRKSGNKRATFTFTFHCHYHNLGFHYLLPQKLIALLVVSALTIIYSIHHC